MALRITGKLYLTLATNTRSFQRQKDQDPPICKNISQTLQQQSDSQDHASQIVIYCHLISEKKTLIIILESTHHQHLPFWSFLWGHAEDLLPSIRGTTYFSQIHNRREILNSMQNIALFGQKDDHCSVLMCCSSVLMCCSLQF